jgi:hypothetical protein
MVSLLETALAARTSMADTIETAVEQREVLARTVALR